MMMAPVQGSLKGVTHSGFVHSSTDTCTPGLTASCYGPGGCTTASSVPSSPHIPLSLSEYEKSSPNISHILIHPVLRPHRLSFNRNCKFHCQFWVGDMWCWPVGWGAKGVRACSALHCSTGAVRSQENGCLGCEWTIEEDKTPWSRAVFETNIDGRIIFASASFFSVILSLFFEILCTSLALLWHPSFPSLFRKV